MEFYGNRVFLHMDMDAFYASVEVRDDPSLKGKPLIIGALPTERGVVSTCSYEARKYGVHSGMSIKEAYRLCPDGIYMHGNYKKYHEASDLVHSILRDYTDLIQYVALDEGYLDITGSIRLFGGVEKIGHEIKRRVFEATQLTCSIGIGYNMLSAKMASEEDKPNGFFIIRSPQEYQKLFSERPVRILHGVGRKTAEHLNQNRIYTVGDLLRIPHEELTRRWGQTGDMLYEHSRGLDNRCISADPYEAKSFSKEMTYQQDFTDRSTLLRTLKVLARDLSLTLLRQGLWCYTVSIKIRYYDLKIITRAVTLPDPTHNAYVIYQQAEQLLKKVDLSRPVRLVGLSLSHPVKEYPEQITLDHSGTDQQRLEKQEKLNQSLLNLYNKYGSDIVTTAAEKDARENLPD